MRGACRQCWDGRGACVTPRGDVRRLLCARRRSSARDGEPAHAPGTGAHEPVHAAENSHTSGLSMYLIADEDPTHAAHRGHGDVFGGDRLAAMVKRRRSPLSLEEIVEGGLCIGCGLCKSVAGADRIQIVLTPEGRERPVARRPLDESTLERINAICPGTRVEGAGRVETAARVEGAAHVEATAHAEGTAVVGGAAVFEGTAAVEATRAPVM